MPVTKESTSAPAAPGRRAFVTKAAVVAAGLAAAGLLTPRAALAVSTALTFNDIPGTGDVKVVNFALALEALEADLYQQALFRLTTGGRNALGRQIRGLNLSPNSRAVKLLQVFGQVEVQHRNFLDAALGSQSLLRKAPFNRARFDFGIENLAADKVMDLVYIAERTGVGAYLGAIPFFETKTYLPVAAGIQGVEARHTAILADVINDDFDGTINVSPLANQNGGRDKPVEPNAVLASVSKFIIL